MHYICTGPVLHTSESLRSSGCMQLLALCDYVKAAPGFSHEIDLMVIEAAKVDTCPDCDRCTLLLLDEMHIREVWWPKRAIPF